MPLPRHRESRAESAGVVYFLVRARSIMKLLAERCEMWYLHDMSQKALTIRLPEEVYQGILRYRRKHVSAYILEAVQEQLRKDRDAEVSRSLESLVEETDGIEYA